MGDQDTATTPAKSERMHTQIKNSKLVVIPNAGHTSTVEEPEAVTKEMESFLLVFSQVSIDGRGQNRLRLRAVFFFAALNPPVGAGGSDPSSQP